MTEETEVTTILEPVITEIVGDVKHLDYPLYEIQELPQSVALEIPQSEGLEIPQSVKTGE